jgi:lysophospholipase L1-like esterase
VALLDAVFPLDDPSPPVLVTVCFGANDAVNENSSAMESQGVSIDNFEMNLKTIAGHLSKLSPPPAWAYARPLFGATYVPSAG